MTTTQSCPSTFFLFPELLSPPMCHFHMATREGDFPNALCTHSTSVCMLPPNKNNGAHSADMTMTRFLKKNYNPNILYPSAVFDSFLGQENQKVANTVEGVGGGAGRKGGWHSFLTLSNRTFLLSKQTHTRARSRAHTHPSSPLLPQQHHHQKLFFIHHMEYIWIAN